MPCPILCDSTFRPVCSETLRPTLVSCPFLRVYLHHRQPPVQHSWRRGPSPLRVVSLSVFSSGYVLETSSANPPKVGRLITIFVLPDFFLRSHAPIGVTWLPPSKRPHAKIALSEAQAWSGVRAVFPSPVFSDHISEAFWLVLFFLLCSKCTFLLP